MPIPHHEAAAREADMSGADRCDEILRLIDEALAANEHDQRVDRTEPVIPRAPRR
jgi:hypothetical protein